MPKKTAAKKLTSGKVSNSANTKVKIKHRVTKRLSLFDRLSQLTYRAACRLLGSNGIDMLRQSSRMSVSSRQLTLLPDTLVAKFTDPEVDGGIVRVTITEMTGRSQGLQLNCDKCQATCLHAAAVLSVVLESKLALGLSEKPDLKEPIENLTEKELLLRAVAEREIRAQTERMKIASHDKAAPWTDYQVTSLESGQSYRVSLRGTEPGHSYCSCPDFRINHLGTCKHILRVHQSLSKKFTKAQLSKPYVRKNLSLRVDYGPVLGLRFNLPTKMPPGLTELLGTKAHKTLTDVKSCTKLLRDLERAGFSVHVYPDAEEFIDHQMTQWRLAEQSAEIRRDPAKHSLRKELLKVELLPYQLDGIAFAVGAGRAVLADDMGLGKTIQGIGTAEMFARLAGIERVLVVCPASLKSQWASEIARFCDRSFQQVIGSAEERAEQYRSDAFFTIVNYEQVIRDETCVTAAKWDLIILDEGQRIKNWESKTSRTFRLLKSPYALVLSGTPLENRLEELYTVVSFVNAQALGPAYRFFHKHRVVNDSGRVEGYQKLDALREALKPVLLRRTRQNVMQQLPERTTEIVRIRPTSEQFEMSDAHLTLAKRIAAKKFFTEMDLLMLQKHLLAARMAANSTYLCNKEEPSYSSKLETLDELLAQLADEPSRKIVLFSEWTTMLNLIEPLMKKHHIDTVRLEGSVPQKDRQKIVDRFQTDPTCRCIMMTNAGATGLNLQSANTVINVELPWNPAVLEQRIARAHRMGQKNPVHVYLLVTEDTIEERMLDTLAAKQDLALAALDVDSDVNEIQLQGGIDELKRRLERLVGKKPTARIDQSKQLETEKVTEDIAAKRDKVASASGELLGAALNLVVQLLDNGSVAPPEKVSEITNNLNRCVSRDDQGRPQLQLTLPNDQSLHNLAQTLAKLLVQ